MAKNGHVHEGGKVGWSDASPTNFFSVYSDDLKIISFIFGYDIFITFEIPVVAYSRPIDKIHISLKFRPSVIKRSLVYDIGFKNQALEELHNGVKYFLKLHFSCTCTFTLAVGAEILAPT